MQGNPDVLEDSIKKSTVHLEPRVPCVPEGTCQFLEFSSRAVMVSHGQFTDRSDSIEQGKPNLLMSQLSVIPFICLLYNLYYLFLAGLSHLVADWTELYYAIYSEMHKIEIRVNQPLYRGFGNSFLQSQQSGFATGFDMFFRPGIWNQPQGYLMADYLGDILN